MNVEFHIQQVYNAVVKLLSQAVFDEQTIPLCNCLCTMLTSDEGSSAQWTKLFGVLSFEYEQVARCGYLRYLTTKI